MLPELDEKCLVGITSILKETIQSYPEIDVVYEIKSRRDR
jgi:hypothetical protein